MFHSSIIRQTARQTDRQGLAVQAPKLDSDLGLEAAQFLGQATGQGKRLMARIERKERQQQQQQQGRGSRPGPLAAQPLLHVILFNEGSSVVGESVNADMLRAGLARVDVPRKAKVSNCVDVTITCCTLGSSKRQGSFPGTCKGKDRLMFASSAPCCHKFSSQGKELI